VVEEPLESPYPNADAYIRCLQQEECGKCNKISLLFINSGKRRRREKAYLNLARRCKYVNAESGFALHESLAEFPF